MLKLAVLLLKPFWVLARRLVFRLKLAKSKGARVTRRTCLDKQQSPWYINRIILIPDHHTNWRTSYFP